MSDNKTKIPLSGYSVKEELLNVLTHGSGLILSIIGLVVLLFQASKYGTEVHMASYMIFGSSLIVLYLASTLYHSLSHTKFHILLKKIDHLAIYFLIAGTYTPIMLVCMKSSWGLTILSIIWCLALMSCFFRISKSVILRRIGFGNYVLMGWLVMFVFEELTQEMPPESLSLLVSGGILYTSGIIFYCWEKLPFNHSIWHLFVLGGSTSHYFSIYHLLG